MNDTHDRRGTSATRFGHTLRRWRGLRRLSQLDLASEADVSARHISFLETGRSRPSQAMVLRLAEALDLTLRDANGLLEAAGFAPAYPARPLSDEALGPFTAMVDQMLAHHLPYPGWVVDRWWNVVRVNETARRIIPGLGGALPVDGIELFYGPGPMRDALVNWEQVARAGWARLRREVLHAPDDERLRGALERLEGHVQGVDLRDRGPELDSPVLEARMRFGATEIATVGVMVSFSTARDVTLDELRLELTFPADEATEAIFRAV